MYPPCTKRFTQSSMLDICLFLYGKYCKLRNPGAVLEMSIGLELDWIRTMTYFVEFELELDS